MVYSESGGNFLLAPLKCGGYGCGGYICPRPYPTVSLWVMISISDMWLLHLGVGGRDVLLLTSSDIVLPSVLVVILLLTGCITFLRVPMGCVCGFCHGLSSSCQFPVGGLVGVGGALFFDDPIAQLFLWVFPIGWISWCILGYIGHILMCGRSFWGNLKLATFISFVVWSVGIYWAMIRVSHHQCCFFVIVADPLSSIQSSSWWWYLFSVPILFHWLRIGVTSFFSCSRYFRFV